MRREWIEMFHLMPTVTAKKSLPPCGGSGLKCKDHPCAAVPFLVSLHAEGVD